MVRFVGRVVVRFGGRIVVLDVASCCVGGLNHVEDPSRIRIWWLLPGYVGRFVGRFVVRFMGRVVLRFVGSFVVRFVGRFVVRFVSRFVVRFVGRFVVRFVGRFVVRFVSRVMVRFVGRVVVLDVASCGVGGLNHVENPSRICIRWLLPVYVGRFVGRFVVRFMGRVMVRFVGRFVVRFLGRFVGRFVSRVMVRFVGRGVVLDVALCGVGGLIHDEDTLQGVAWDQASGVAVACPLVRMRMPDFPAYAPEQGDEMTAPGRLFVC